MSKELKRDKNKKGVVFTAMSGGVDSSVAALLLKRQSYKVVGVFMKCWTSSSARIDADKNANLRGKQDNCSTEQDAEDARRVAEKLMIPFYVWDFEDEYKKKVVEYMIDGYKKGITPNPDVMCNREIKFGLFLKKALQMGADYIATGHYIKLRVTKNPALSGVSVGFQDDPMNPKLVLNKSINADKYLLSPSFVDNSKLDLKSRGPAGNRTPEIRVPTSDSDHLEPTAYSLYQAKDKNKDQSYFLWTLTQKQLKYCLFPIGDYLKSEVREIARRAGLPTAEKKDSQGICFLGKVSLEDFLKQYISSKRGDILDISGKKIGEHKGAQFYTIGQRHIGLANRGLTRTERGLTRKKDFKPVYVAEKDIKTNTLVVVDGNDNPALYKKEVELTDINFINPVNFHIFKNVGIKVLARVRYHQPLMLAKFIIHNSSFKLIFDEPQKFIAPGQSAVFYSQKEELLGGGVIK